MKNKIVILTFLYCWLLSSPSQTPADQVRKHSVLLKEVRELKNDEGIMFAEESIYRGGLSNLPQHRLHEGQTSDVTLTELRAPVGSFQFTIGSSAITVKTIPLVVEKKKSGIWYPAPGQWDFKTGEDNSYESVVHVQRGGDLDIVFQSTGMRIGKQKNVVHYGLSGNPHAISLSRKRLKGSFPSEHPSNDDKPILSYQPPDDVILIQMNLTARGLLIQPIFEYEVEQ